jgi:pSer/pThr/pTyr-binding forkhead associated (FHA) protein
MTVDWLLLGLRLLAPLFLYSFLILLIQRMVHARRADQPAEAYLRRLDGPDMIFALQTQNTLGREPDNSLLIDDHFISAHHATLTYREGGWWLADLGSTNGTLVNDVPVDTAASMPLTYGDIVRLGEIQLRLEKGE